MKCRHHFPYALNRHSCVGVERTKNKQGNYVYKCKFIPKRNDPFVNVHTRVMLQHMRSNVDIQLIVDSKDVKAYVCKYASKAEESTELCARDLNDIISKCANSADPTHSLIKRLMIRTVGMRDYSAQEACHHLFQFPIVECSIATVIIVLYNNKELNLNARDGEELTSSNMFDAYMGTVEATAEVNNQQQQANSKKSSNTDSSLQDDSRCAATAAATINNTNAATHSASSSAGVCMQIDTSAIAADAVHMVCKSKPGCLTSKSDDSHPMSAAADTRRKHLTFEEQTFEEFCYLYSVVKNKLCLRKSVPLLMFVPSYNDCKPASKSYGKFCHFLLIRKSKWYGDKVKLAHFTDESITDDQWIAEYDTFMKTQTSQCKQLNPADVDLSRAVDIFDNELDLSPSSQALSGSARNDGAAAAFSSSQDFMVASRHLIHLTPASQQQQRGALVNCASHDYSASYHKLSDKQVHNLDKWIKCQREGPQLPEWKHVSSHVDINTLNEDQCRAYKTVEHHFKHRDPKKAALRMIISGTAGTGKSHIIHALFQLLGPNVCKITATTGVAAFNIGGVTVHSFLSLPILGYEELGGVAHRFASSIARAFRHYAVCHH